MADNRDPKWVHGESQSLNAQGHASWEGACDTLDYAVPRGRWLLLFVEGLRGRDA